jgi:hypothetical protein
LMKCDELTVRGGAERISAFSRAATGAGLGRCRNA